MTGMTVENNQIEKSRIDGNKIINPTFSLTFTGQHGKCQEEVVQWKKEIDAII